MVISAKAWNWQLFNIFTFLWNRLLYFMEHNTHHTCSCLHFKFVSLILLRGRSLAWIRFTDRSIINSTKQCDTIRSCALKNKKGQKPDSERIIFWNLNCLPCSPHTWTRQNDTQRQVHHRLYIVGSSKLKKKKRKQNRI